MGFWLALTSVTLNDLERHNDRRRAVSLRYLSFLYIFCAPARLVEQVLFSVCPGLCVSVSLYARTSVQKRQKLENVAIANALQLKAARRRAIVLIRFTYDAGAKFEVAQPFHWRLIVRKVCIAY